jgi:hypothetical protein
LRENNERIDGPLALRHKFGKYLRAGAIFRIGKHEVPDDR